MSTENCHVACGMQPLQHSAAAESLNVFLSRCFMSQSTVICTLKARLVVPKCTERWMRGRGREGVVAGDRLCSPAICSISIKSQEALRINRPLGMPSWHMQSSAEFAWPWVKHVCCQWVNRSICLPYSCSLLLLCSPCIPLSTWLIQLPERVECVLIQLEREEMGKSN